MQMPYQGYSLNLQNSNERQPPEPIFDLPGDISLVQVGGMQKFEYHFTNDLDQGYSGEPDLNALEKNSLCSGRL